MRRITLYLLYIVITIVGFVGCHDASTQKPVSASVDSLQVSAEREDSAAQKLREAKIKAELNYSLERHNVQDEGYEMVARYAASGRDTFVLKPMKTFNIGRWQGILRQGGGTERDCMGRVVVGNYENDTLVNGIRVDALGTYAGDFSNSLAHGHGSYWSCDDVYFEGHWANDQREGFGFSVSPESHVRAGEWKNSRFMGERMSYTTERIYGIDISRYQHGKGRKKYPILWNRLRISHLGTISRKQVNGVVDYPVSFIFIKSTESTTICNPYYLGDNAQAHKHGIPIGAYHFFSTRTSGRAQANYFLQHTVFRKGDLPPVLDVEPSDYQIARMGGIEALHRQMLDWLLLVESKKHVKPIVYISQSFVNKYLSQMPDIKRDYKVWIARYGAYKPDVKLAFWQLCPDGRVQGIHGEVDINVFNGYQQQFEEFLEETK